MIRHLLAGAAALALTACAVGPNFQSPAPSAPALTPFAGAAAPVYSGQAPPATWWKLYNDPALNAVVAQALAANTDLRVAEANLTKARALRGEARSALLPSTTLGASATRGQSATQILGTPSAGETDVFDTGLDVSYQVDLFGKVRRAIQSANANLEAVEAARDVVAITVAAETARAYTGACAAGAQLAVARRSLDLQQRTLDLNRQLLEFGGVSGLEVARSSALAQQTRATIPTLEAQRSASLYALAALTGRPPTDYPTAAADCAAQPKLSAPIPVGDGARLMGRRPDLRQADRRLAQAVAQVGVATADLYPSIQLGGSVGATANATDALSADSAFRYSFGPLITWTFPNIAVARSRIAQTKADSAAALATFDGTWLNALRETETALSDYAKELDRNAALGLARDDSARAADLAQVRFSAGADSNLALLDAQRTLATTEAARAASDAQLTAYQINLFLALGGGWEALPQVAAK